MTFEAPYLLLGLLVIPIATVGYVVLERRRVARSAAWSRRALQPNIVRRPPSRLRHLPVVLSMLGVAFLLVGFARPQHRLPTSRSNPPTIVLAVDTSGSMAANDVAPTRLQAARRLAIRFLHQLPSRYRAALVTFADNVHLAAAPTFDREAVIAKLPKGVTPLGASAIGDGISRAVSVAVAAAGQNERGGLVRPGAVLVFSDGAQTASGATLAAAAVAALVDYVPVNTVALGTRSGFVIQPAKSNGVETSVQLPVPVKTVPLQAVSKQTGGSFFQYSLLAQSPSEMSAAYQNLRTYESSGDRTRELSWIAAGLALVCIVAGVVLSTTWFARVA